MMGTGTVRSSTRRFCRWRRALRRDSWWSQRRDHSKLRCRWSKRRVLGEIESGRKGVKVIGEVTCLAVNSAHAATSRVIVETTFSAPTLEIPFFKLFVITRQDDNDESQTLFGGGVRIYVPIVSATLIQVPQWTEETTTSRIGKCNGLQWKWVRTAINVFLGRAGYRLLLFFSSYNIFNYNLLVNIF